MLDFQSYDQRTIANTWSTNNILPMKAATLYDLLNSTDLIDLRNLRIDGSLASMGIDATAVRAEAANEVLKLRAMDPDYTPASAPSAANATSI